MGYIISILTSFEKQCLNESVLMPFNGLHPFLHCMLLKAPNTDAMCQCPLTGFIHFYEKKNGKKDGGSNVSMPFNGLHPFLQKHGIGLQ